MNIQKLVIRNIFRRKGRFIFTLLGIVIGIAAFVSLLAMGQSLDSEVKKQTANLGADLVVTPKGWCAFEQVSVLTGEQLPEAIPYDDITKIAGINGLTVVPYLTEKTALDNNPVPVNGVIPEEMKTFKGWQVERGQYFGSANDQALIIGTAVAQQFKLNPGDLVTIRGQQLPVKGVLQATGSNDDVTIFVPLTVAQKIYGVADKVSFAGVKVDDISKTDQYSQKIEDTANVAVVSDKKLLSSVQSVVGSVGTTLQLIAGVALMAAAFGIINTMMTAISERRRQIGILKAMGAKRSFIFATFFFESGVYGLLGGILGVVTGSAVSFFAAPYISQNEFTAFLKGSQTVWHLDGWLVFEAILFSLILSLISGIYPAWRASRLTPVEAISYE